MRIGEVAKKAGVSVETIRFYQSKGLLLVPEKPNNGFRQYSQNAVERLSLILMVKKLGFSLDEISSFLNKSHNSCLESKTIIEKKITEVEGKISKLKKVAEKLHQLSDRCNAKCVDDQCLIIDYLEEIGD